MDIRRRYVKGPYKNFNLCAEDWGYGLFYKKKPRQVAIDLIHSVFGDDVDDKYFIYWVRKYNGPNNLQDMIKVYMKEAVSYY